ncbi:carboxypeptidase-like regulatory domain-containing protein [Sphingobacterium faecale]|uniref:Carboxypeptidase regulatory-like domain-containing protein n=1 Tax=Sphingobacterium faecale TaxID=2803775 RepID=A0ABS1QZX2_9SPHI|nr:carboxypeptidase-like regulatory domain-containing protein [Sphingobacterium faecale]MBL1407347.1 carboxypeptidase regulatory-like domain-containing protein [Sphingobacterium faecale]
MRFLIGCLLFFMFVHPTLSQTKIYGSVVDTLSNRALRNATVSIYQEGVGAVQKVTLTDLFGKFTVDQLNHNMMYRAEFSYQGYQKLIKEFSLDKDQQLDFGRLHLERQINEIEEVTMLPPVRMKGDTIEFNADAFQLDTNAVVEDLIHKLPGIIVWGDGKITYNGKEVPSILINGKEFFGSDKSIGLRNIAKDAVQKVQVYDNRTKQEQREKPLDASYEMNVVLKGEKEKMLFGNITVGAGTDKRYENYLNLNYADKRTQSSLAYANNNANKNLNSLDQLLKNTTYKGVGINADYHSDFSRPGINRQHVLAARYQHDFLATKETDLKNIITANVFSNWDREDMTNTSNTLVSGNNGEHTNQRSYHSLDVTNNQAIQGDIKYELTQEINGRHTRIKSTLSLLTSEQDGQSSSETDYDYSNNQSRSIRQEQQYQKRQSVTFTFSANWGVKNLGYIQERNKKQRVLDRLKYGLDWRASLNENDSQQNSNAQIENRLNPDADQYIDRSYNNDYRMNKQQLIFTVANRKDRFKIINAVDFNYSDTDQKVSDIDGNTEMNNTALTHASKLKQSLYTPKIEYSYRIFERDYTGRLSEYLAFNPSLALRLLNRTNSSSLGYRNIKQRFVSHLPKLEVEYRKNRYGTYFFTSTLGFQRSEDFPTIDQLQPIYDDINPAYRYFGNPNLSKTEKQTWMGRLQFEEHKTYALRVNINAMYNTLSSGIRDSIVFAPGQQQVFSVNMAQDMYDFNTSVNVSKPFVIKKDQTFTIEINASSYRSKNYQYIDEELQKLAPMSQDINFITYYTNGSKYQLSLKGGYNQYDSRNLTAANYSFSSVEYYTAFGMACALTKKMKIGSDINGRFINSNKFRDDLAIWNANVSHRFTKGNNLEAKLALYDILKQNKGMYVRNGTVELTTGHRNSLRQFFQLSLAYYPRKFGL